MSQLFTVDRVTQFLRIAFALIALFTGAQAYEGAQLVKSREDGIASATSEDAKTVGGNAAVTAALAFMAANKKMIETALKALGVPDGATKIIGDVIDAGRLNNLRQSFHLATTKSERDGIRATASLVADEMFDGWFPPEKTEAVK